MEKHNIINLFTENNCNVNESLSLFSFEHSSYGNTQNEETNDESSSEKNEEIKCSICLNNIICNNTDVMLTNCGHMYHTSCFLRWYKKNNTCPMCKSTSIHINKDNENENNQYIHSEHRFPTITNSNTTIRNWFSTLNNSNTGMSENSFSAPTNSNVN
jgi:hypothetical protein